MAATPVNEDEFTGARLDENYRAAQGTKADGKTRVGGIFLPGQMKLPVGEVIYRFGNKARSLEDDRRGRWWVLESTLRLNAEHAHSAESLVRNLRQNLAVPPAFNAVDRVFVATVQQRLRVFAGVGGAIFRQDLDRADRAGAPPVLAAGIERDGSSRSTSLRFQLFLPGLKGSAGDALAFGPVMTTIEWLARFRRNAGLAQTP